MKKKAIKFYKRPSAWRSAFILTFSLSLLIGAGILRFFSGFDNESELEKATKIALEKEENKKGKPNYLDVRSIDSVGVFENQVKPVSFAEVMLENKNQHEGFQDAEYVAARKDAWTIQVMDVEKEDVIIDYLATNEKKEQFAYFRYITDDKKKRYILIFDDFNNEESANKALEKQNFALPKSIKPTAKSFKSYIGTVDQYHLESRVRDYKRSRYRQIRLIKTKAPVDPDVVKKRRIETSLDRINKVRASKQTKRKKKKKPTHKEYVKRSQNIQSNGFAEKPSKQRIVQSKPKTEKKQTNTNDQIESLINQIND